MSREHRVFAGRLIGAAVIFLAVWLLAVLIDCLLFGSPLTHSLVVEDRGQVTMGFVIYMVAVDSSGKATKGEA